MRLSTIVSTVLAVALSPMAQAKLLSSDDEIRRALVGNTISGEEDGETYAEFIDPNGRISGEAGQERYTGRWRIAGGQICLSYDIEDKPSEWDCSNVGVEGSQIVWFDEGEKYVSNLTAGNPRKL